MTVRHRTVARLAAASLSLACLAALPSCASRTTYKDQLSADSLRTTDGWYDLGTYRYRGDVRGGLPNGRGEARFESGTVIVSSFVDGVANGDATITVPGYGTIDGTVRGGELVSGRAYLDNGDYYRGGFREYQFHGEGLAITARGELAAGTFAAGRLEGRGVRIDAGGTRIEGTFRNGSPTGEALVSGPRGAAIRSFDAGGNDRTAQAIANRVIDEQASVARAEAAARARELSMLEDDVRPLEERAGRIADIFSAAFKVRFKRECGCYFGLARAGLPDGLFEPCLTVEGPELARRTEEEKAAAKRAEERRRRACSDWVDEIADPGRPQRAEQLLAEIGEKQRAMVEAAKARQRAEDEARRLEQQRRTAEYQQSVREGIARAEAENRAAAERREAAHKARCADSPAYAACYCRPPQPPRKDRPGASCQ